MARAWPVIPVLLLLAGLAVAIVPGVSADEAPAAVPAPPVAPAEPAAKGGDAEEPKLRFPEPADVEMAPDDVAEEALAVFADEFKAKGLKGDDKLSQRDWAMSHLVAIQHPDVVKALAKQTKHSHQTIRTLAVIYLGEMRAMPALAGQAILAAMAKNKKNDVLLMSGLQALGRLQYIGGGETITTLIKHKNYAIKKTAILAVGDTRDMRLIGEILKIAGISDYKHDSKKEVVSEGYSYDGVDVTYDTGTAGDGDQQMAEKIGKEQLAKNKAAATGGGGSAFGGGASGLGMSGGGGGSSRSQQELLQAALKSLFRLTGEKFTKSSEVRKWLKMNRQLIGEAMKALEQIEKDQRVQGKEQKK